MASLKVWHFFQNPQGIVSYVPSGSSTLLNNYTYFLDVSLENWGLPSVLSLTNAPVAAKVGFSINGRTLNDGTQLYSPNYYTFQCDNISNSHGNVFMPIHNNDQTKAYLLYGMGFVSVEETRTLRVGVNLYLWSLSDSSFKNVPEPDLSLHEINIYY